MIPRHRYVSGSILDLFILVILLFCVNIHVVNSQRGCILLHPEYSMKLFYDGTDSEYMTFEVSMQEAGWMGIGLQIPGVPQQMGPGDFYIGWIPEQNIRLALVQDRNLQADEAYGLPHMDEVQNIDHVKAFVYENGTNHIIFRRKKITNDPENDINLVKYGHNLTVMFAHGDLPSGDTPFYHGANRGTFHSIDLTVSADTCTNNCPSKCSGNGYCDTFRQECRCFEHWHGRACQYRDLSELTLPEGFKIEYFATQVPNARQMTQSGTNSSIYYVGSENAGVVSAVIDWDNDYQADSVVTVLEGLSAPNGVLWLNGDLYVAETYRLVRYNNIDDIFMKKPRKFDIIKDGLPDLNGHTHCWRPLRYNPDHDRIYIPIGTPCNYCLHSYPPGDPVLEIRDPFGTITSMKTDGSDWTIHSRGVRNSVGVDFHPVTGDIWFTDNARDGWGYDKPWGELNRLVKSDNGDGFVEKHYGFPYCYGTGYNFTTGGPDPLFNNGTCDPYMGAALELGPHVAPLGIRFYTGDMFPQKYKNQIFIAEHGGWGRPAGSLMGYQIKFVQLDSTGTKAISQESFISGWLEPDKTNFWAKPVDIMLLADGSMLISDDMNNSIFRVTYDEKNK